MKAFPLEKPAKWASASFFGNRKDNYCGALCNNYILKYFNHDHIIYPYFVKMLTHTVICIIAIMVILKPKVIKSE